MLLLRSRICRGGLFVRIASNPHLLKQMTIVGTKFIPLLAIIIEIIAVIVLSIYEHLYK